MTATAAPLLLDTTLRTLDLKSRSREAAFAEIATHLGVDVRDASLLRESLMRRERFAATAIGKGVALPNLRTLAICAPRLMLARSLRGIGWEAADGEAVHLVGLVLSPAEVSEETHHEWLARAAGALRLQRTRQRLLDASSETARLQLWREILS
jgi:mannitol/fructose-specific phosphotransferase system IIA component (Ntr-type)